MIPTFYPGASYPDAWPTGERVMLYAGRHLSTHLGDVAFPAGEGFGLMFLHCTPVGGFKLSGLAHDAVNLRYEWAESAGYRPIPGVTSGRTVYDHAGVIRDELPAGYQYVDETTGDPVSRLITYGPTNGLSEWSIVKDLAIGQGHDNGGILVWDGTHLRVLVDPPEYDVFVNVHRIGANVTISYATLTGAWIIQTTLDELRALPLLVTVPDTPVIVGPPAPNPEPPKPDPPTPPTPAPDPPTPSPPPPQETAMIAYAPPVLGFKPGEFHDNGDGSLSVQKPNGKWLCVTPEGGIEERDSPGGAWESFKKGKSSLIAERDGGAKGPLVYVLPLAE